MRKLRVLVVLAALLLGACKDLTSPTEPPPPTPPCRPGFVIDPEDGCRRPGDFDLEPE